MKPSVITFARRIAAAFSAAVVLSGLVPLTGPFAQSVGRATAKAVGGAALTLIHQELALGADQPLVIQLHPPAPLDGGVLSVRVYPAIELREQLKKSIKGDLSGFIDQVAVDPADPTSLMTDADGNVTITVQTESAASTGPKLRFRQAGLYPVVVSARSSAGEPIGDLVTFVYRLPDATAPALGQFSVAVLASVTAAPATSAETQALPPAVAAQLAELVHYSPDIKVSLAISPEILGRLDESTRAAIVGLMANGKVMAQPLVPFDPSSAIASDLGQQFTNLLAAGADTLVNAGLPYAGDVWYAPGSITDAGALLLRTAAVRTLVIPSDVYLGADGNLGDITDYSQLFKTVIAGGDSTTDETCGTLSMTCMPTAVVDPLMSSRFTDASLSDEQAALYTAADVVVYREQFSDNLSASNRHALVLGLTGEGVANAQRMNRAVQMLGATGAANFITLDDLEQRSSALINDGRQIELKLPAPQPAPTDLHARAKALADVRLAATTVASMLVDDGGRFGSWISTIDLLYSTAISDEEATPAIAAINASLASIRACVKAPAAYPFTLAGKTTNLPLPITNSCGEPLKVIVRLTAAANKLDFPDGDLPLTLEPYRVTTVQVPVTARTNGSFDVTLQLLTPTGEYDVTDAVTLHASINALTGLPQVITGAGLLILLTWWVRNLRRSRHQLRSIAGRTEHPVARGEPD